MIKKVTYSFEKDRALSIRVKTDSMAINKDSSHKYFLLTNLTVEI